MFSCNFYHRDLNYKYLTENFKTHIRCPEAQQLADRPVRMSTEASTLLYKQLLNKKTKQYLAEIFQHQEPTCYQMHRRSSQAVLIHRRGFRMSHRGYAVSIAESVLK